MSKKVTLPGNENSNYGRATAWMRKAAIFTKADLAGFLATQKDKAGNPLTEGAIAATTVVLLSPRLESGRGDCRGNMSNPWGHLAYVELLNRKVDKETGKKEAQKYRFRMRKEALEPSRRTAAPVTAPVVEAEKVAEEVSETSETVEA